MSQREEPTVKILLSVTSDAVTAKTISSSSIHVPVNDIGVVFKLWNRATNLIIRF